jgi:hypothetical protein
MGSSGGTAAMGAMTPEEQAFLIAQQNGVAQVSPPAPPTPSESQATPSTPSTPPSVGAKTDEL